MQDKLTGMERYGQLFVLFLASFPTNVRPTIVQLDTNAPQRYTNNKNNIDRHPKIIDTLSKFDKWLHLFEKMISITSWLKLEEVPVQDINKSINVTLKQDNTIFSQHTFDNNGSMSDNDTYLQSIIDNIDASNDDTTTSTQSTSNVNTKVSKSNYHLRQFLRDINNIVPNVDIKKFQRLKLHHTLHYDDYIAKNGCVANFNGGTTEEHMKSQVTHPGSHTQQRLRTLCEQTARRYAENLIVNIAHNIAIASSQYKTSLFDGTNNYFDSIGIDHYYTKLQHDNTSTGNSTDTVVDLVASGYYTYAVSTTFEENEHGDNIPINVDYTKCRMFGKDTKTQKLNTNSHINSDFLKLTFDLLDKIGVFDEDTDTKSLVTFTTLHKSGDIFRCSDSFYGTQLSEWFDWINVAWSYDNDDTTILPAKLLMFIDIDKTCHVNNVSKDNLRQTCPPGKYWAVIKSAAKPPHNQKHHTDTLHLATHYNMYDQLSLVSCYNIESPAFVIYDRDYSNVTDQIKHTGTIQHAISITEAYKWAGIFMKD